ncbi:sigma-70 domain-containing protein [Pendulispora albinea]
MLKAQLGRAPTPAEICAHTGLSPFAVRHALALARVMRQ